MDDFLMREMVMVGEKKLIGEVISLERGTGTIQVYEETSGLRTGEMVTGTGKPLSVKLGPGIITNIFDGIQRPLSKIYQAGGGFIPEGIGLITLDEDKLWDVEILAKEGEYLKSGDVFAQVQETSLVLHKVMVPPGAKGRVKSIVKSGAYSIAETLAVLEDGDKHYESKTCPGIPVGTPTRPENAHTEAPLPPEGNRYLLPLAKGGTAAISEVLHRQTITHISWQSGAM